jgi:hypothetical protein
MNSGVADERKNQGGKRLKSRTEQHVPDWPARRKRSEGGAGRDKEPSRREMAGCGGGVGRGRAGRGFGVRAWVYVERRRRVGGVGVGRDDEGRMRGRWRWKRKRETAPSRVYGAEYININFLCTHTKISINIKPTNFCSIAKLKFFRSAMRHPLLYLFSLRQLY